MLRIIKRISWQLLLHVSVDALYGQNISFVNSSHMCMEYAKDSSKIV